MATSSSGISGELFGASGRHARVVVMTITEKEFPVAKSVFGASDELVDIDMLGAWTHASYAGEDHLPFVVVTAGNRSNLGSGHDIDQWVRQFQPQAFILIGTAGGVRRPVDRKRLTWKGPRLGDVMVSEYVHYGDYAKLTASETLRRFLRMDQPAEYLVQQAMQLLAAPDQWHPMLGDTWSGEADRPKASQEEFLSCEQIQDDPLQETAQYLMEHFDRAGAVEMESAGMAKALHNLRRSATYAPGYLSVRGVSDLVYARDRHGKLTDDDIAKAHAHDKKPEPVAGAAPVPGVDKASERDDWTPRAAASASAFAFALVRRVVYQPVPATVGHPAVPRFELQLSDRPPTLES